MSIAQTCGICILGAVLCLFLRETSHPQAAVLGLALAVGALLSCLPDVQRIVGIASNLFAQSGLDAGYFGILCKAVGIAYITNLGCDICKDCGVSAAASALGLCGRVSLAVLGLPLFVRLAEIVLEVMG